MQPAPASSKGLLELRQVRSSASGRSGTRTPTLFGTRREIASAQSLLEAEVALSLRRNHGPTLNHRIATDPGTGLMHQVLAGIASESALRRQDRPLVCPSNSTATSGDLGWESSESFLAFRPLRRSNEGALRRHTSVQGIPSRRASWRTVTTHRQVSKMHESLAQTRWLYSSGS